MAPLNIGQFIGFVPVLPALAMSGRWNKLKPHIVMSQSIKNDALSLENIK